MTTVKWLRYISSWSLYYVDVATISCFLIVPRVWNKDRYTLVDRLECDLLSKFLLDISDAGGQGRGMATTHPTCIISHIYNYCCTLRFLI